MALTHPDSPVKQIGGNITPLRCSQPLTTVVNPQEISQSLPNYSFSFSCGSAKASGSRKATEEEKG